MTAALPPCPIVPLPGRVVLADAPTGQFTASGIMLPTKARAPGNRCVVMAVGEGVAESVGLAPGDLVAVGRYSGDWHKFGEVRVRVMMAEDVMGRWVAEEEAA